jgi:hypothetical protein
MRSMLALVSLCLVACVTRAAEPRPDLGPTITTTDGVQYTRAADGNYYRSQYVRASGSVMLPTGTTAPRRAVCVCGDSCQCEPGACPAKCPVQSAPALPLYHALPGSPGPTCPGGACPAPTRPRLFR